MGAASASAQNSAMPQGQPSQGKGGGAPLGNGSPAMTGVGKGVGLGSNIANQMVDRNNAAMSSNGSSIEDTYRQQLGREGDAEGLAYWKGQFGDTVDAGELQSFQTAAAPELAGRQQPTSPQGKGGGAPQSASQSSSQGGPQLPNAGQQGWQYGQGASGDRVTYPSTSGQQQFGQPMQNGAQTPYSNTIGQGQQSNQMGSSGKGKGA